MESCPQCQNAQSLTANADESYPRVRACSKCGYPLDFDKLWQRALQSSGTDAAEGSLFGPGLRALTYEGAMNTLRQKFRYGVDALAEYENAIVFRVMDSVFILNFGPAGDCFRYWPFATESENEG